MSAAADLDCCQVRPCVGQGEAGVICGEPAMRWFYHWLPSNRSKIVIAYCADCSPYADSGFEISREEAIVWEIQEK